MNLHPLPPLTLVGAQADARDERCSRWGIHTRSPGDWTQLSGVCPHSLVVDS